MKDTITRRTAMKYVKFFLATWEINEEGMTALNGIQILKGLYYYLVEDTDWLDDSGLKDTKEFKRLKSYVVG